MNPIDPNAEWIEADGLGGFASGTVSSIRTRRYHARLMSNGINHDRDCWSAIT